MMTSGMMKLLQRLAYLVLPAAALLALVGGCAAVKPYEMENMADELMTNSHEVAAARHEMKWLEAREGSTGGVGGAGGGCACK